MNARKNLPPPADDDLSAALRRRLNRGEQTASDTPRTPRTSDTGASSATPERPATVRRSWYLPKTSADALAAVVDDLHHETRRPKHEVLAALIAAALDHRQDALDRLTRTVDT